MLSSPFDNGCSYGNHADISFNAYSIVKPGFLYDDPFVSDDRNFIQNLESPERSEFADYPKLFEEHEVIDQAILSENSEPERFYVRKFVKVGTIRR